MGNNIFHVEAIRQQLTVELRSELLSKKNVVAVGIGHKEIAGEKTDKLGIVCLVVEKKGIDELDTVDILPNRIGNYDVDVIESGPIVAHGRTDKIRPVPAGVSCGHYLITAGTIGLWVKQGDEVVLLSNNHVLANSNEANIGDDIIQPGDYDGGSRPSDTIAYLKDYAPIDWDNDNLIDAAIASLDNGSGGGGNEEPSDCFISRWITSVLNWLAGIFSSTTRFKAVRYKTSTQDVTEAIIVDNRIEGLNTIPTGLAEAYIGMPVVKSGRTTGVTYGDVTMIDATVDVGYGGNKVARFVNQIITTNMSQGGDSGSVLLTEDGTKLVGLLFAGSSTLTVHSRIQNVFNRFNLDLLLTP